MRLVKIDQDMDAASMAAMKPMFEELADSQSDVCFDLSGVDFLDSVRRRRHRLRLQAPARALARGVARQCRGTAAASFAAVEARVYAFKRGRRPQSRTREAGRVPCTRSVVIVVSCLGLSGCSSAKAPGLRRDGRFRGIHADHRQAASGSQRPPRAACAQRGAPKYDAAAYADAELLLTRSRRELAAGLVVDANADIARLERQVDAIEATLGRKRRGNARDLS